MHEKTQIIAMLRQEYKRWEAILAGLTVEQIITPSMDANWSIKDVMAHLWAWQQRSIARMDAALNDTDPVFPQWPEEFDPEPNGQPHDLNAWIYATYRDKSWSDVYKDWKEGFLHFLDQSQQIAENDLLEVGKYWWLEDYPLSLVLNASREHHEEHRSWLPDWISQET